MEFTFNKHGDYKTEFRNYVDTLFATALELDRQDRIQLVDSLTETYVITTGKTPDGVQLDRLASFILKDELADKRKNKMQAEEYPLLSERQRETRERSEADFKVAEGVYGSDKRKHGRGTRNRKNNTIE